MLRRANSRRRRGAIIPLVAVCLVAIMGLLALAIDIGMLAVAKTQAQNAADAAAMAGTRTFNQQSGYNLANVPKQGVNTAMANKIFGTSISGDPKNIKSPSSDVYTSGDVKIECGGYYYVYNDSDSSKEEFKIVVPGKIATEPYTAVRATITTTSPHFFGKVFGASPFNVKATAIAAHRPRDVVIVMDLSGSMRFQSCPGAYVSGGITSPNNGPRNKSFNPDPLFPKFGHYSATSTAAFQGSGTGTTGSEQIDQANISVATDSGDPVLKDIMSSGSTPAFTYDASKDSYATTPGGDNYLMSGSTYVKTVTEFLGSNPTPAQLLAFERSNSSGFPATWKGYTEGPGYWGKTFFVWPPNPGGSDLDPSNAANHADNGAKDWRQRFFFKEDTSNGNLFWLDHNSILFNNSSGTGPATSDNSGVTAIIRRPDQTRTITEAGSSKTYRYRINYAAIFNWLRTTPVHFPTSMTTGRINYYSKIPDPTGDTAFNNRFWTQNPMTDKSERFWKEYVDFMLGLVQTGANTYANTDGQNPFSSYLGNGDFYSWGTVQIGNKADCNYKATISSALTKGSTPALNLTSVQTLTGTAIDLPGPNPITGATNASPIVITSNAHGLANGNIITIQGVTGNTAANGTWQVQGVTTNTFQIKTLGGANTTGNGNFTTTGVGAWVPAITGATNANPIVITTGAPHRMTTGTNPQYTVTISGVTGNTAANGKWHVNVLSATTFSLTSSTGSGTFSSSTTQWWEPVYYIRFGNQHTFYEVNPATVVSGTLAGTPDIPLAADVASGTSVKIYTAVPRYMDYGDNVYRPRHQYWFGPLTWIDWLGNYSVGTYNNKNYLCWPGNVHEAQAWACKAGISSAIDDIKNNHPNDFVGMTFFSSPSTSKAGGGQHNIAVIPLGRNYQGLKDSLWFPPSTVSGGATSITPYDADFDNVPRARGGTAPGMGFMISYNLLSSTVTNLRNYPTDTKYRGFVGGLGRKGASRIVIFETDGAPNTRAYAALAGTGSSSYYPIRLKDPTSIANSSNEFPAGGTYSNTEVYNVVKQICAQTTASPPGYSTTRKTAYVYALGYGSLFDPSNSSTAQTNALTFLQTVQYHGNVAKDTNATNFPDWQRIYGNTTQRQNRIRDAFTKIMQSGVQVSLLE